jgi:L-lysine 2,3-aminomutase
MKYWSKLTIVEKESLLSVAKNYVQLKEEGHDTDELRKQLIREEREKYLKAEGKSHTWDEVKEMAANKEKRNGI